jgi:hypothetical protein
MRMRAAAPLVRRDLGFKVGFVCALTALCLAAAGCMTDATRNAFQGAVTEVNQTKSSIPVIPPIGGSGNHDPTEWAAGK